MKTFTFFWLTDKREVLEGNDYVDALNKAGYSQGAIRALDFWKYGDNDDYNWNSKTNEWIMTPEAIKKLFGR